MRVGVKRDRILWELLLDELTRVGVRRCNLPLECDAIHEDQLEMISWQSTTAKLNILVRRGWVQEIECPNHPHLWILTKVGAREACVALHCK